MADARSVVLIKLGSNVFLGTKISFANEMARIADATFLGVYVPKGEHHVRLVYQPLSFAIGGAISALMALLLLAFAAVRMPRQVE